MKKFLLFSLVAMLLPVAMTAQSLRTTTLTGVLQRAGVVQSFDNRHKAPAQIDLASNQMILGHYDTDEVSTDGLGLTGMPGVLPIAIELTPAELEVFRGGKIVAFRVGLAAITPVTRVFAAPVTGQGIGEFTEWSCNVGNQGWNVIPVDPPYEIADDENLGLFIGFDYQQTSSNYPISAVDAGVIYPSYMYLTSGGQTAWFDVGLQDFGNLSLQCIVESDHFPQYAIQLGRLTSEGKYFKSGDPVEYTVTMRNAGVATIDPEAVVLDVYLDGEKVGELNNAMSIGRNFININGSIPTEGLESGAHNITITTTTLNGEAIESPKTLNYEFFIYANSFPRQKHLIEQLTSNSCTYCPLGTSFLQVLSNLRDDIAWVGIHGNQSTKDPANTAQCDSIFSLVGAQGWPYGVFDRSTGWNDDVNIASGLGYYEENHVEYAGYLSQFLDYLSEMVPTFATIDINSEVNPLTREATISVTGEITPDFDTMMGEDAKLTVYITEDSVVYRQLNQGKWIPKYVHNGVLRLAVNTVKGMALNKDGETYKNDYSVMIPDAWNIEKLNVIAFISRPIMNGATGVYTDMYVNNTEKVPMTVLPVTAAPEITTEVTDSTVTITASGEGEVLLYVDGELVENPYTIERGLEDVTITVVATAQDGDKLMNTVTTKVVIPAKESDAVNELFAGKTVARVRYFNMMGQEMTSPNGATLVVTTYTDGTTTAAKVLK